MKEQADWEEEAMLQEAGSRRKGKSSRSYCCLSTSIRKALPQDIARAPGGNQKPNAKH